LPQESVIPHLVLDTNHSLTLYVAAEDSDCSLGYRH
jgi:hypothetical protein